MCVRVCVCFVLPQATVLWYLSDVQGGGETIFPMANGAPEPADKRNCDVMGGIRVPPRQGRVIMFYSLLANGDLDAASLHASCAVREGTKWAANKWCVWGCRAAAARVCEPELTS
jgi:prolyl 4-hydroxylase